MAFARVRILARLAHDAFPLFFFEHFTPRLWVIFWKNLHALYDTRTCANAGVAIMT